MTTQGLAQLMETGRTVYGLDLGIVMLDTRFARPSGDVGNAATFGFPVAYDVVRGADPTRVLGETDPALLEPFVAAVHRLEELGVRAITTSCGFLAIFQRELAAAARVPVLTSALLQVPLASAVAGPGRRVAILTGRDGLLGRRHFEGVGWSPDDVPVVVRGFAPETAFARVYSPQGRGEDLLSADPAQLEAELRDLAERTVADHPDVGAIVLECTNFVPYGDAVRRATGLPVFDFMTLVRQTHAALG